MSNTPAAKRRRVDSANATLRQPFRSPIIKAPAGDAPAAVPTARKSDAGPARKAARVDPPKAALGEEPTFVWRERRGELEGKNAALEEEMARLRGEEGGGGSERDELDGLVVKWRAAAQQAADELFEASRSRVESMGGMKELAAMRRRQAQFFHEEFAQGAPRPGSDDGSGGEEAREPEPEPQEEEEEYTMATMLRSLNVDPEVIGYDAAEEAWK